MNSERPGLRVPIRRERGVLRGVPIVELWVADSEFVFRRITGIWDSGASRTLLTTATYVDLLHFRHPQGKWQPMDSASARRIYYQSRLLHIRVAVPRRPAIHFSLIAGVSKDVVENLFGADMIDYFSPLIQHDRVILFVDDRNNGGD
jgi:hypothetical protein